MHLFFISYDPPCILCSKKRGHSSRTSPHTLCCGFAPSSSSLRTLFDIVDIAFPPSPYPVLRIPPPLPSTLGCSDLPPPFPPYPTCRPRPINQSKKLFTLLDLCVSSLRRGHANLLCIVPILTDDPRRESKLSNSRTAEQQQKSKTVA